MTCVEGLAEVFEIVPQHPGADMPGRQDDWHNDRPSRMHDGTLSAAGSAIHEALVAI